jgi:predicted nucleic acid-binding protein
MSGVDFLDSNVPIYLFDRQDARRRGIAESLIERGLGTGNTLVGHQVVQEPLDVITRIKPALDLPDGQQVDGLAIEDPFRV